MQKLTILLFTLLFSLNLQALNIISWNLKDFGKSRDDLEIKLIAEELRDADIVAIQEVVAKDPGGAKAVARLADQLNRMGAKWDYRISDPTNSSSPHKSERYAFLWKTSIVTLAGGRPNLISGLADQVEREPYQATFRTEQNELITIVNYHACTHKNDYPERAEIQYISQWLMTQKFENIIWAGDMNLKISDQAFDYILSAGYQAVLHGEKTSLKTKCVEGVYLSRAEDNVLYKLNTLKIRSSSVRDFIANGNCHDVTWKRVSYSDHLGVGVTLK